MGDVTATAESTEVLEKFSKHIQGLIEKDAFELPMLPQVASQAMSMASDPNACLEDLSDLIHKDQVLAGNVLRIANSAAFCGGSEQVVSLSQALARMGMALMGEIAMSASLKNGIFEAKGHEDLVKALFSHSLAAGNFGKEIARMKRYNVEGQYLGSLLHAIGKPVVLKMVIAAKKTLDADIAKNEVLALIEKFHVQLGKKISLKWKLPQTVDHSIEYYLKYEEAKQFKNEAMMTALSHHLASWALQTEAIDDEALKKHPIFMALNIYPDEAETLMEKKDKIVETVNSMAI